MMKIQEIQKNEIRKLIPHDGLMCLIDKVLEWDEKRIVCSSETHQSIDNPLRNNRGLPITALIEYGTQAMAIHGGLLSKIVSSEKVEGYVASLRDVSLAMTEDVSKIKAFLHVEAIRQMSSQGNMIYTFTINTNQQKLVSGRATVSAVLDNQ